MFGNYRIKLDDMIGQVMTGKKVHVTRGPFLLSFPSICMCVMFTQAFLPQERFFDCLQTRHNCWPQKKFDTFKLSVSK